MPAISSTARASAVAAWITRIAAVANIPLNFVNSLTEVNAAAGCTRGGRAFMVATAAILVIHAATAGRVEQRRVLGGDQPGTTRRAARREVALDVRIEQPVADPRAQPRVEELRL